MYLLENISTLFRIGFAKTLPECCQKLLIFLNKITFSIDRLSGHRRRHTKRVAVVIHAGGGLIKFRLIPYNPISRD